MPCKVVVFLSGQIWCGGGQGFFTGLKRTPTKVDRQPSKPSPVTEVFISKSAYTDSFFPGLLFHTDNLVKSTPGFLSSSSSPVYSHYFPLPGQFFLVRYLVKEMREVTDTPTKRTLGHIPSPPFLFGSQMSLKRNLALLLLLHQSTKRTSQVTVDQIFNPWSE